MAPSGAFFFENGACWIAVVRRWTMATEAQVRRIVKTWQKRMNLDHWRITVNFDASSIIGSHASIFRYDDYDIAEMRFHQDWKTYSVDYLNELVVHELMHCECRNLQWVAVTQIEPYIKGKSNFAQEKAWDHAEENHVQRMAEVLVALGGVVK